MCNIAGYAGTRPAAPILLEMMRRQEGLCGGYYSGIATIHEGKIYYTKLTGDLPRLEMLTNAANLPGTVGIIHSRSNSGGGDNWSHPFVSTRNGEVLQAYVANGSAGIFAPRRQQDSVLAEELLHQGYDMNSRDATAREGYPALSDGSGVHMSDAMCQLIRRNIDRGQPMDIAMAEAYLQMPGEIVGLLLSVTDPDGIAWSRINMPMMLAFCDHGAYLASSAMGIIEDAREAIPLPVCAGGVVYKDRYTMRPYRSAPCAVAPVTARVRKQAYDAICEALKQGPQTIGPLEQVVTPLFDKGDCVPATIVVYDVLLALKNAGILRQKTDRLPGARADLDAPKTSFWLED